MLPKHPSNMSSNLIQPSYPSVQYVTSHKGCPNISYIKSTQPSESTIPTNNVNQTSHPSIIHNRPTLNTTRNFTQTSQPSIIPLPNPPTLIFHQQCYPNLSSIYSIQPFRPNIPLTMLPIPQTFHP